MQKHNYSDNEKERVIEAIARLNRLEGNEDWKFVKQLMDDEIKKQLDILTKDDIINNVELIRGKIIGLKFIFEEIEEMRNLNKRIQEAE